MQHVDKCELAQIHTVTSLFLYIQKSPRRHYGGKNIERFFDLSLNTKENNPETKQYLITLESPADVP